MLQGNACDRGLVFVELLVRPYSGQKSAQTVTLRDVNKIEQEKECHKQRTEHPAA